MKGSEYEQFVFEKFKRLFADGVVTKNDHIRGHLSGIDREVDVSIRIISGPVPLLYIAQCKDWKTPVDIKILGEFSAVIRDVQAAKGFLLCTSGFAKTNHQYARTLGIELVTIEDIQSKKWKTEAQIPFVYIRKNNNFKVELGITANEALVEKNRDKELQVQLTTATPFTEDGGATTIRFEEYVNKSIEAMGTTLAIGVERDICRPNLDILFADVWVPCSEFTFTLLNITKRYYLKYLTPDEYSHLRDHVRGTTLPLHVVLKNVGVAFDESFVELPDDKPPVFPGLYLEVEEWTPVEQAQMPVASLPDKQGGE
jgi:hypothetical protein